MGFRLDDMTGKFKDFARNYLFYCRVNYTGLLRDHPYLVSSASLPTHTIEPLTTNWQGMQYKIAGTHTFAEYTITFKSDDASELRKNFVSWMEKVHNPVSNVHGMPGGANSSAGYFSTIELSQLNGQGAPIMNYKLIGAWPSSIAETALDYGSKEISTFGVTFNYQYFVCEKIYGGGQTAEKLEIQ